MQSNWPFLQISECAKVYSGFAFKSQDLGEEGIPVVKIKNVNNRTVDIADTQFFPEELVTEKHDRFFLDDGDVLIAMTGQGSVGRVGRLSNSSNLRILLNQRVGKFIPNQNLDLRYFYYVASSSYYEDIFFNAGLGSGQPNLSPDVIGQVEIPLPPLPEQKAIAHILGTLDDKIELNRRMNATLEGMAQALFKSWFVDFDPVIDNALAAGNPIPDEFAPRAEVRKNALVNGTTQQGSVDHATLSDPKSLFPAAFHFDHELGWIPEGWEVTSVEHERTLRPGLAYKAKHKAEIGTPMVTLGSVSFTERFLPKGLVNYTGEFKPQHLVSPGDLVIASHDITQERKQLGSPAMIPRWVSSEEIIVATNLFKLSNDRESYLSDHFLYWTLRADKFREEMIKSARGTAILFINRASAGKYLFARPPRDLSQQFDGVAESLYDAHQNNEVSSRSLIAIRDTLLPKLISGDLRSGDAESVTDKETKEISA